MRRHTYPVNESGTLTTKPKKKTRMREREKNNNSY